MARPRKNRLGEYAGLLGEELGARLHDEVARALAQTRDALRAELAALRTDVRRLTRQVDALARRSKTVRAPVGRWVPGGPGRPPKDAAARIAAFEAKHGRARGAKTPRRK
ncbi:hypothetical protein L6R52_38320 [Myxococcota bacterium]|nr:hypothetical protein [Myxococcota bacterium]